MPTKSSGEEITANSSSVNLGASSPAKPTLVPVRARSRIACTARPCPSTAWCRTWLSSREREPSPQAEVDLAAASLCPHRFPDAPYQRIWDAYAHTSGCDAANLPAGLPVGYSVIAEI